MLTRACTTQLVTIKWNFLLAVVTAATVAAWAAPAIGTIVPIAVTVAGIFIIVAIRVTIISAATMVAGAAKTGPGA
jgi:hypothetical protein